MRLLPLMLLGACGPHLVAHPVSSRTFAARPDASCGQELARATFVAKGSKWGESVRVQACADAGLEFDVDIESEGQSWGHNHWNVSQGRGGGSGSTRCLGGMPVSVVDGPPAKGTTVPGSPGTEGVASPAGAALEEIALAGEPECFRSQLSDIQLGPLVAGSTIRVRVWSRTPSDLVGALLRITHSEDRPNVSDAEWARHLAKQREKELARPYVPPKQLAVTEPSGAPPPPRAETRPPAPSLHAEWIPGYWYFSREWHWIGGHWDVPRDDQRISAPFAPPALRPEAVPPAIGVDVIWMPGYWAWDGRIYVWVAGGWRR